MLSRSRIPTTARGHEPYIEAVEREWGMDVDYAVLGSEGLIESCTVNSDTIEKQIDNLDEGVLAVRVAVEKLSSDAFLGALGNWTPRDVVAHLVGWHRYTARGARQLLEGELPFYEIEPGEDYSRANARLVAEYPSEDRVELLAELEKAAGEMAAFLRSLSEAQWRGGSGVLVEAEEMTIRQNVDWLIEDHHHHSEQIQDLATSARTQTVPGVTPSP